MLVYILDHFPQKITAKTCLNYIKTNKCQRVGKTGVKNASNKEKEKKTERMAFDVLEIMVTFNDYHKNLSSGKFYLLISCIFVLEAFLRVVSFGLMFNRECNVILLER